LSVLFFLSFTNPTINHGEDEGEEKEKQEEMTYKAVAQKKAPALLSHLLMIWVGSQ
jgi:hypothetical protein